MKVMGLVGMLSICSVEDLWKRQIHLVVISAFGILGVLLHFYDGKQTALDMCGGMLVGIVLYLLSIFSHGKVGKGDAFLVTSMGVYLGFWDNMTVLGWHLSWRRSLASWSVSFLERRRMRACLLCHFYWSHISCF